MITMFKTTDDDLTQINNSMAKASSDALEIAHNLMFEYKGGITNGELQILIDRIYCLSEINNLLERTRLDLIVNKQNLTATPAPQSETEGE